MLTGQPRRRKIRYAAKEAKRASPGQGRTTLQQAAWATATSLGHDLSRFYSAEGKSKRKATVLIGGRLVEADKPSVFRAVCRYCGLAAIVDQYQWEHDNKGFGGAATRDRCARTSVAPTADPAQNGGEQ